MAIPAIGFHGRVGMAGITEFLFAGVAYHTGQLQTLLILLALNLKSAPLTFTQDLVAPNIKELHVGGPHLGRRQNTGLGILG
jgi:hypothetical protein